MITWIKNYGFTFAVEAETEEEAERLLDEMAQEELGLALYRDAWAGDIEAMI